MFRILESIAAIEINKNPKKFRAKKNELQYEHHDLNSLMNKSRSRKEEEKTDGSMS